MIGAATMTIAEIQEVRFMADEGYHTAGVGPPLRRINGGAASYEVGTSASDDDRGA
jgi:hypothetical protein